MTPTEGLPAPRLELRIDGVMLAWYDEHDLPRAQAHAAEVARRPTGALVDLVRVLPDGSEAGVVSHRAAAGPAAPEG